MSDDEVDYSIASANSGASAAIPIEAGQIKKGGHMMIKGRPCKVLSIAVSKTGKHGHAKCNFTATDIFTGKKLEDMIPSSHGTTMPLVTKADWEIVNIDDDGELTLMDEGGNQKVDLNLPLIPPGFGEEIREAWDEGENSVMVSVQSAVGEEQVISFKKVVDP